MAKEEETKQKKTVGATLLLVS